MTIKSWKNIEDNGNGRITVILGDKKVPLRYTVHQMEELSVVMDKVKGIKAPTLKEIAENDLNICMIALNPEPDKVEFTREEITALLDVDQIKILVAYWLEKKVYIPTMDDPPKKNQKN